MRKLISILNPVYWTTAQEIGEAVNGYTLTEGIFRRETQVEFATGEKEKALGHCTTPVTCSRLLIVKMLV